MTMLEGILSTYTKPELIELANDLGLKASARMNIDAVRSLILASSLAKVSSIVTASLSRDSLKAMCRACGLEDTGKEKTVLVARLHAAANGVPVQDPPAAAPKGSAPRAATHLTVVSSADESESDEVELLGDGAMTGAITRYTHTGKKRMNNPPVGLVTSDSDRDGAQKRYEFDPHLDPRLDWAGRRERDELGVDTVSLHVHERVDPLTIISALGAKGDKHDSGPEQPSLFEQPEENPPIRHAIEFYQHQSGWTNRLVAGDSALVMNSLLEKEGLGGQVQMIYIDPPYGISYNSNFQPFVGKREVRDKDDDLTQEPETLKAFRDTWELGIHSYLSYLRDRLVLAKSLLTDSGSCFVQISDENLHLLRNIMDEVFGNECFVVTFCVKKKGNQKSNLVAPVNDYIVWYSRRPKSDGLTKFRPVYVKRELDEATLKEFRYIEFPDGTCHSLSNLKSPDGTFQDYRTSPRKLSVDYPDGRLFRSNPITNGGVFRTQIQPIEFEGRTFNPGPNKSWRASSMTDDGSISGMERLRLAGRLVSGGGQLGFKRYLDDFGFMQISNWWDGLGGASNPIYVVQTNAAIVQRCMLMTTDPGDLVLDPTSGSGTTAVVAEQWGRRWIAIDTSRVAVTLSRQRLMTSAFKYYKLKRPAEGVGSGFDFNVAPRVTLGSIANNPEIVPGADKDAIASSIRRYAETVELYDQPKHDPGKLRVTGPFTVEAVPAPLVRSPSAEDADEAQRDEQIVSECKSIVRRGEPLRQSTWLDELKRCGIRARKGEHVTFTRLEAMPATRFLHADGETRANAGVKPMRVVIAFGPEHAPLEQRQVEEALREAGHLFPKPEMLVFAAFQFDAEAARDIDEMNSARAGIRPVSRGRPVVVAHRARPPHGPACPLRRLSPRSPRLVGLVTQAGNSAA
jgi:adenine-specific DNA-methyltransferase